MASRIKYWELPEQLAKLRGYMRRGLSLKDTALKMGITEPTLKGWIKQSPSIRENLKAFSSKADLYIIEDKLISAAKKGEQWAVNRFLDAYGGPIYNPNLRGEFLPEDEGNETFNEIIDVIEGEVKVKEKK